MPCINIDNLIYLNTYDSSNSKIIVLDHNVGTIAKEDVTYDFFYIQFSNEHSFRVFDIQKIIPTNVLQRIRNKEVFLILDNGLEYFYECANAIYKDVVMKHNVPAEQIIFLSAVPTMYQHVKALAKKLNMPEIKVDWFSCFEANGQDAALHNKFELPNKRKYKKKFLNLNRRWRLHRPLLVTLLKSRNLLNAGHVSFGPSDDNQTWDSVYPLLQHMHENNKTITDLLEKNKDIQKLPPLYLDTQDLVTNRAEHEPKITDYYADTYFSIVTETTYYENIPFLSEKIFKAIGIGHPFIMVSAPNSLQYLKKLGYKTYSPYINETYDTIQDHGDRMLAILDEVERLCAFSKSDLKQWLPKVRSIARYNKSNLTRKNYTDFIKTMNY